MKLTTKIYESAAAVPQCARLTTNMIRGWFSEWPWLIGEIAQLLCILLVPLWVPVGIARAHWKVHKLGNARVKFLADLKAGHPVATAAAQEWWKTNSSRFPEPAPTSPSALN